MKRRILSIITALALCLSLCPTWALAAEADPALCPHHREHTEDCGYTAPAEGQPCGHEHTAECYALEVLPDTESGDDYEIGADTENLLDCQHTHDSECGYAQADPGQPCGYECRICPIEDLIAALPDKVTEDNAEDVRGQLDEILALFSVLTEDEQEQIDLSRCYALQGALDEANAPMLAAEGAVTITDKIGNAVTLKDGKYYTVNSGSVGGVTEQDTAPEGNVCYLTYANGVLTAYHPNTILYGTVSVTSDLTVKSEPQGGGLVLVGSTAPVLSLNSHTLTLDSATSLNVQVVFPPSDCAVEGGTIQYSPQSASALISINNMFGLAAKDLTVQNAANVQISGNTNSGGVVENLTVINSSVAVRQGSSSNPTIVVENQITTDTPVLLQRPDIESESGELITEAIAAADGKIWAYGGEAPTDELDINDAVTANTCWKAGDGMIYYEPAGDGGAARLTLDNASYEGNVYVSADSVEVVLTGGNQIGMIYADKATLTGSGSFTGMIDVNKNGFINNSSGKLNAMVILKEALIKANKSQANRQR